MAAIAATLLLWIVLFVFAEAWPALSSIGLVALVADTSWNPTEGQYNLWPMLIGTVLVSVGAVALALPLGLGSAMFCQFYAPPLLASLYRRLIELLAGIPSVVYGFWGLVTLVPAIGRLHPPGPSLLAGVLILSLMILPTIALTADASFAQMPMAYRQGTAALGFSRWGSIWRVMVPAARSGLGSGVVLATGRALGETMAVLMVCGNVVQLPDSVFAPVRTLTANIALEMAYALDLHRSALFVSGLVLLGLVAGLIGLLELLLGSKGSR